MNRILPSRVRAVHAVAVSLGVLTTFTGCSSAQTRETTVDDTSGGQKSSQVTERDKLAGFAGLVDALDLTAAGTRPKQIDFEDATGAVAEHATFTETSYEICLRGEHTTYLAITSPGHDAAWPEGGYTFGTGECDYGHGDIVSIGTNLTAGEDLLIKLAGITP